MTQLYKHQQDIIAEDKKRIGLFLGTGSGKTRTALLLARGHVLVICPKTQKEDQNWERELRSILPDDDEEEKWESLMVISKETFRRDWETLPHHDTVIVDEAHTCLGVTPNTRQRKKVIIPKASQLFEALQDYLNKHRPERLYLCTATIIRSPMTVWGASKLLGADWDFYKFRHTFYTRLPMPGREVWTPKNDQESKDHLASLVKRLGYIGRLEDFFDVPEQTFKTDYIELTAKQKTRIKSIALEYPEPIVKVGKIHQIENGVLSGDEFNAPEYFENNKINKILDYAYEFPKIVVFAKYTAQIEAIATACSAEGYNVITLTGSTKDRGEVIAEANRMDHNIFVVQAQISAGWELPTYPVMIFASRTYSFVDYDQALGRIQRANNIKKNLYINLVVKGGTDEAVDKCLKNKQDFNEAIYAEERN